MINLDHIPPSHRKSREWYDQVVMYRKMVEEAIAADNSKAEGTYRKWIPSMRAAQEEMLITYTMEIKALEKEYGWKPKVEQKPKK